MEDTERNTGMVEVKIRDQAEDPVEEAISPVPPPAEEVPETRESQDEEIRRLQDRGLRQAAEFENYKKRSQRETEEFRKYAQETVMKDLLHVVDNLERAMESARYGNGDIEKLMEGVDLTLREILRVMERYGVTPITSLGEPFDPTLHQALMAEESGEAENTVLHEMQRGYKMKDRLLRPALVVVAKAPEK